MPQPDLVDDGPGGFAHHPLTDRAHVLEAAVAQSTEALMLSTKDGDDPVVRIRFVNEAFSQMMGFGPDELIGQPPGALVGPDTDLDVLRRIEGGLRKGESVTVELVLHDRDGGPVRVDATYRTVSAPGSDVVWFLATYRDLSEQVEAAAALRRSEAWAEAMVQGSSDLVMVADADGVIRYASPAVTEVLGYRPEEFVARTLATLIHPDDLHHSARIFDSRGSRRSGQEYEFRAAHRDGSWRTVSLRVADRSDDPGVRGFVVNLRDVSERRRAEVLLTEQADLLEVIALGEPLIPTLERITGMLERHIDQVTVAIGRLEDDGVIRIVAAPSVPLEIAAYYDRISPRSVAGDALRRSNDDILEFGLVDDPRLGTSDAELFARHGFVHSRTATLRTPGTGALLGSLTLFHRSGGPLADHDAALMRRAMNLAAIAIDRHNFAAALEYQALYDPLTALPNRALLLRRIREAVSQVGDDGLAVLLVDLDRFKVINDSEGHATGDLVLEQVAERLGEVMAPGETLGRFGGDEFMVVCTRLDGEAAAEAAAARIAGALSEPLRLDDDGELFITASVGIAYTNDPEVAAEALIRNADVAMYRAKDQGRDQRVIFQHKLDQSKVDQLALERALRSGIERKEFELYYQPLVRLADGAMTHVEALVRWNRDGHGVVQPKDFIWLAEETGLIVPLGWWVLGEAACRGAEWPKLPGGHALRVSVNLSARQLADPELVDVVRDVLEHTGLNPTLLCFEITESALVRDVDAAVRSLNRLKELGVRIAIDDFGTGYATLDYVRHFSMADELKIDQSFVEGVDRTGSQEEKIVSAAIVLAKSLGFTVVAEGVETVVQMEALRELDCDLAQGFLFSPPVPLAAAVELLAAGT